MTEYDMPIYLSDWILQVRRSVTMQSRQVVVKDIIVKGYSKEDIMSDLSLFNKALSRSGIPKRDQKKSKVMNVVLKQQLGYGIRE
tara:strand:+ start:1699 stop:1953 length:255 start_codon:yes stop_codon:yes gene_type:complete